MIKVRIEYVEERSIIVEMPARSIEEAKQELMDTLGSSADMISEHFFHYDHALNHRLVDFQINAI